MIEFEQLLNPRKKLEKFFKKRKMIRWKNLSIPDSPSFGEVIVTFLVEVLSAHVTKFTSADAVHQITALVFDNLFVANRTVSYESRAEFLFKQLPRLDLVVIFDLVTRHRRMVRPFALPKRRSKRKKCKIPVFSMFT